MTQEKEIELSRVTTIQEKTATAPSIAFKLLRPSGEVVALISQHVIDHLRRYQQEQITAKEAGGQLFSLIGETPCISLATGPNIHDKRSRAAFEAHGPTQRREIKKLYKKGLHFVGDWHTHPEAKAKPSGLDIKSTKKCFVESKHDLNSFLILIVGTARFPDCIYAALVDGHDVVPLKVADADAKDPAKTS